MLLEHPLHLGRGDVLPASDDELLQATDDGQPTLGVERPEVAGGEPPAADGLVGLGPLAVPDEELGSPHEDLAGLPRPAGARSVAGSTTLISASPTEWPSVSRALSIPSCQLQVVTVGASVDP